VDRQYRQEEGQRRHRYNFKGPEEREIIDILELFPILNKFINNLKKVTGDTLYIGM